jgi:hypothetical protein
LGTQHITTLLEHLVLGTATLQVVDNLRRFLVSVTDSARCYLPTQEQRVIASLLDSFPDDLAERLSGIPGDAHAPLPKIADLRDGIAHLTAGPPYKHPDWTLQATPVRLTRR